MGSVTVSQEVTPMWRHHPLPPRGTAGRPTSGGRHNPRKRTWQGHYEKTKSHANTWYHIPRVSYRTHGIPEAQCATRNPGPPRDGKLALTSRDPSAYFAACTERGRHRALAGWLGGSVIP